MSNKVALCADSNCLKDPIDLGLKGERILEQTWILPFADALIARQYLREHPGTETWVVSSDSIDGINLAAALKKDNRESNVHLFIPSPSGSKMSRCQNAGIIPICGSREFAHLYTAKKLDCVAPERIQPSRPIGSQGGSSLGTQDRSKVTVTRIDRNSNAPTGPLPTIEIEDIPMLTRVDGRAQDRSALQHPEAKERLQGHSLAQEDEGKNSSFDRAKDIPNKSIRVVSHTAVATEEGATIVSVVSGSGGTGKSSVTAMAALLAQKRGIRTLLLDADFQFGDLKYLLGYKDTLDTSDILEHPEQIDALLKVDTWPALLAAPAHLEYSELMNERIGELLNYLKPHFDLIVVNTGSTWSDL